MNCTIASCEKAVWARGLCPMHLRRLRVHGDPNYTTPNKTPQGMKLKWLKEAIQYDTDKCIIWPFKVGNHGYGALNYDKSYMLAHHVVLILFNRKLPIGLEETRHTCHTKKCVNNKHLEVGEPKDNSKDRIVDGTTNSGTKRYNAKLTEEIVQTIRELAYYRGLYAELARKYKVSPGLIQSIRKEDSHRWTHVRIDNHDSHHS